MMQESNKLLTTDSGVENGLTSSEKQTFANDIVSQLSSGEFEDLADHFRRASINGV
jgi:hypothetical protein